MKILKSIVVVFIIISISVIGIGCTENKDVDIKVDNKEENVDNNVKEEKGDKEDVMTLKEIEEKYNGRALKSGGRRLLEY